MTREGEENPAPKSPHPTIISGDAPDRLAAEAGQRVVPSGLIVWNPV
jgi:hypothetical protein